MRSSEDLRPSFLTQFFKDDAGATAVEYALLAALISVIVAGAIGAAGTRIYSLMANIVTALNSVH